VGGLAGYKVICQLKVPDAVYFSVFILPFLLSDCTSDWFKHDGFCC